MGLESSGSSVSESDKLEQRYDRLKLIFLGIAFFFVIGSYTVTKELKNSIFAFIVGREYIPWARSLSMFVLVPAILLYSFLVDRMRRYQLLSLCSIFYAVVGIGFVFLLGHNTLGIPNTNTSPYRLLGWLFYFFIEGFSPFVVSVFWAFANSISNPEGAKKNYGYMVSFSKLGGMTTAGFAWWLLQSSQSVQFLGGNDTLNHQVLLGVSSCFLLVVPFVILILMKKIPGKYLHGYEAVYQLEKQKKKDGDSRTGILAGLKVFIKYPYVLGIFSMGFFYELVVGVLSYLSVAVAQAGSSSLSEVSYKLFEIVFASHFIGFFISFFGTGWLLKKLGTRLCLLLIPVTAGLVVFNYLLDHTALNAIGIALIALRSIHYGFSFPIRESLYIPTVKEIKFKSKSWIDSFGSKFTKSISSAFNVIASRSGEHMFFVMHSVFFALVVGLWFVAVYLLGKRFEKAVEKNEVIGANDD